MNELLNAGAGQGVLFLSKRLLDMRKQSTRIRTLTALMHTIVHYLQIVIIQQLTHLNTSAQQIRLMPFFSIMKYLGVYR